MEPGNLLKDGGRWEVGRVTYPGTLQEEVVECSKIEPKRQILLRDWIVGFKERRQGLH